jgi:hypothetical protein
VLPSHFDFRLRHAIQAVLTQRLLIAAASRLLLDFFFVAPLPPATPLSRFMESSSPIPRCIVIGPASLNSAIWGLKANNNWFPDRRRSWSSSFSDSVRILQPRFPLSCHRSREGERREDSVPRGNGKVGGGEIARFSEFSSTTCTPTRSWRISGGRATKRSQRECADQVKGAPRSCNLHCEEAKPHTVEDWGGTPSELITIRKI